MWPSVQALTDRMEVEMASKTLDYVFIRNQMPMPFPFSSRAGTLSNHTGTGDDEAMCDKKTRRSESISTFHTDHGASSDRTTGLSLWISDVFVTYTIV